MTKYLVCTDLDRTLIPNGTQPSSPGAIEAFSAFTSRKNVTLAYVSGRHLELVKDAIKTYRLPQPLFAICDVGSSIYQFSNGEWQIWRNWQRWISSCWCNLQTPQVARLLGSIPGIQLQEESKQGTFKLSYYANADTDTEQLIAYIRNRLKSLNLDSNLIWSIDTEKKIGLLDILPAKAGKLQAIRFIMRELDFNLRQTLFAGDSGNDLDVMTSEIPSVLVANAEKAVRIKAEAAHAETIYFAKGGWQNMNGNYSAGILEGIAHFWPETTSNLTSDKV